MKKTASGLHVGLLILRLGIGISFFFHGLPKLTGGEAAWTGLGEAMEAFGIGFAPTFWGFMAAFAETAGGLLFAAGILFRPASLLLAATMAVALAMHLQNGDGFTDYSHAMEALILFVAMVITGPGKYAPTVKIGSRTL